ncbi:MAG: hypothetical protein IKP36_05320 [Bacteroidaceae bacterium]|nr:hypothetical protein [Bacteroidaceae bacterium]
MTKKTQKIILWVIGIWLASCIVFGGIATLIDNSRDENVPELVADTTHDIKKDSLTLLKAKQLYDEMISFKDKEDFKTYGLGVGGPYNDWLKRFESFPKEDAKLLIRIYGFAIDDILQLALHYAEEPQIPSVKYIQRGDEIKTRIERIFDLQIRLATDYSSEVEKALASDDKEYIGKWKLTAKAKGYQSHVLEIFSSNGGYYYLMSFTDGTTDSGKLIRRGHMYYIAGNLGGEYYVALDKILLLCDDSGEYEDGTKGLYDITQLK